MIYYPAELILDTLNADDQDISKHDTCSTDKVILEYNVFQFQHIIPSSL